MAKGKKEGEGQGFRQSMASLHTWAGLIPGWILFLVFLFGTASFFRHEISAWMRPELTAATVSPQALAAADALLAKEGRGASSWDVSFPHPRGGEALTVGWPPKAEGGKWTSITLDPVTGQRSSVRETEGGDFLFHFHYNLRYLPWWVGRYIIVFASLAMLVAILSGIVTHKKIFTDFFMLRFGKGQRSWLDAHNVTSVLALPFHLMITYTGLVIFAYMLMPWPITANFESEDAYFEASYPSSPDMEASGRAASIETLSRLVAQAARQLGQAPSSLSIQHPGDAASVVTAYSRPDTLGRDRPVVIMSGVSGTVLKGPRASSAAEMTRDVMVQLHAGWFAAPVLRWLYFLAGASGTVMIASGLVLWTVKRRAKLPDPARPHFGFRLVERLNIGIIAGAPAAIAIFFLDNRLLPLNLANREHWEVDGMFIAWTGLFIWSLGRPAKQAWIEILAVGALFYVLVPVINGFTTPRGLFPSLIAGDWTFAGFDVAMLAMAALLALAARKAAVHKPKIATRKIRNPREAVA